jgi:hypothetical protein
VTPAVWALLVTATVLELAPIAAALRRRPLGALPPAQRLLALCFALMFLQDVTMAWLLAQRANNQWVAYLGAPVQTVLLLLALAHWQIGAVARRAVRLAAAGFVAVWALLMLGVEDPRDFSRFASPLRALLVVAVAAWTMVRRSTRTLEVPAGEPWFWVCAGLLLYFGTGVVLGPVSRLLYGGAPHLVLAAHNAKSVINIFAYLLVARGMLCRQPSRSGSSGGSSWPPASPPSSSPRPS